MPWFSTTVKNMGDFIPSVRVGLQNLMRWVALSQYMGEHIGEKILIHYLLIHLYLVICNILRGKL